MPQLIDLVIEYKLPIVNTSAGSANLYTQKLKDAGIIVMHVVSSTRTALKAAEAGVDVIGAKGVESGGKVSPDEVPTISPVPKVLDAVDQPVIAAGGLADGRGLAAALNDFDGTTANYTAGTGAGLIEDVPTVAAVMNKMVAEAVAQIKASQAAIA